MGKKIFQESTLFIINKRLFQKRKLIQGRLRDQYIESDLNYSFGEGRM